MPDSVTAIDEVFTEFNTVWAARTPILWPGQENNPPADGSAYAYVAYNFADGFPASLTTSTGQVQLRRLGTLLIQIYTPRYDGYAVGEQFSNDAVNIFATLTTTSGVIFRNVFGSPLGLDPREAYWQNVVTATFQYDEFQ